MRGRVRVRVCVRARVRGRSVMLGWLYKLLLASFAERMRASVEEAVGPATGGGGGAWR